MTLSLYQIAYTAPGNLSSPVFDFFVNLEFPGQTSSTVARVGDTDTSDWAFLWFVDGDTAPTPREIIQHIHDARSTTAPDMIYDFDTISIDITPVPDKNWLAECYRTFPPFTVGTFFVRGSHNRDIAVPPGHIGLTIDAATAFGSGEHSTTKGCMTSLITLRDKGFAPARILDLGTGSGILAIAARKLWPSANIIAVDNDPESVNVATEYAEINNAPMTVMLADTPRAANVAAHGPFDLIIANILAGPLRMLAPDIAASLSPTGVLILSGLLNSQIDDVAAAYAPFGWTIRDQIIAADDWAALTLQNDVIPAKAEI